MQFVVLGPVGAVVDGATVPLARAQRRAVLAYLLLNAGVHVTADRLVDALWGDDPPATAKTQVQIAVSHIRSTLRGAGHDPISSGTAGYLLTADAEELDLGRFRGLAARARDDLPLQDKADALRRAVAEWRSAPLAGVTGHFVATARASLVDEFLSVVEELFEVELDLGRHAEIVADLTRLNTEHPLRERLAGQLMLALHGSGRQADALAVYRRTRRLLTDDLGIEPNEHLQALHRSLLSERPPTVAGRTVPHQLPPQPATFVGRTAELRMLAKHIRRPAAVVTVRGLGGSGKTALAVRATANAAGSYPDGCLFIDLRGTSRTPADPHTVLAGFLRALGVPNADVPLEPAERLGLYRTVTADRRIVVVLDNAHDEAQVRPLLPSGRGCATIITSRRILSTLDGSEHVELPLFDDREGEELLRAVLGPQALAADRPAFGRLLRACAGLPLAVRIVAARLTEDRNLTPVKLAAAITEGPGALGELAAGDLGIVPSLQATTDLLDPDSALLLSQLARTAQSDFVPWTAAALLGAPAETALAELKSLCLITPGHGDRFQLHDLVRMFGTALPGTNAGVARLFEAYTATAFHSAVVYSANRARTHASAVVTSPFGQRFASRAQATAWLEAECANMVAAVGQSFALGWYERTWQLAYNMRFFFRASHRIDEWTGTHQLALEAAVASGDLVGQTRIRESLTACLGRQRRFDEQLRALEPILDLCREIGDRAGLARCHDSIGSTLGFLNRLDEALEHHRAALSIPEYAGEPQNEAVARVNIGVCLAKLGRVAEGVSELEFAKDVARAAGDTTILCFVHHNLAECYLLLGDTAEAQANARAEIVTAQRGSDADREARGWEVLGDALARDDLAAARDAWQRAIAGYDAMGNIVLAERLRARV